MSQVSDIVQASSHFVSDLFKEKLSEDYVYHNYNHTFETVKACQKLAAQAKLNDEDTEILLLAAWFHDTGYIYHYKGHEEKSKEIAADFLKGKNYPEPKLKKVLSCIEATKRNTSPADLLGKLLCDADISSCGEKEFSFKAGLLRAEWEKTGIRSCDDLEWAKTQVEFLSACRFQTEEARRLFGSQLDINLQEQKEKLIAMEKKTKKKKNNLFNAEPKRGIETMFRSVYRNHITLSSMADNKANMMISINTIIISLMLTIVGAKFSIFGDSVRENPSFTIPAISLIITSLGSVVFAILSARPKITGTLPGTRDLGRDKSSILFFGNFTKISVMEFEERMEEIMKDQQQLYGNMIRDLYYLGKVLSVKYSLLRYSYTFFMIGLIVTVLLFIGIFIFVKITNYHYPAH